MCVGKGAYAQAVGGIQLPFEELAADVLNLNQLKQAGGGKEGLDIRLLDDYVGGVTKVDEQLHGILIDVAYGDLSLARFLQFASEHGTEVGAAGGQDYPVGKDLPSAHVEHHIAELPMAP